MFLCTPARTIWVASVLGASGMSATGAMTCRRPGSSRISSGTEIGPTRLLREALVTELSPIKSLKALRTAEEACTRCPLYKDASQLVPGEGPARAHLMMVGEQPGDQEDKQGRPFVGPAGGILAKALADAGIDRKAVFVTNAVKHFKFEPRGKRRLHKRPKIVDPDIVVAL